MNDMTDRPVPTAPDAGAHLVDYLATHVAILHGHATTGWRFPCVEALVLDQGRWFTPAPLPAGRLRGPDGECAANAAAHSRTHGLTYVEGFAYHDTGLITLHAWTSHADGTVEDPTWPDGTGLAYLGVGLSCQYLDDHAHRTGGRPVLFEPHHDDYRLLRDGLPDNALVPVGASATEPVSHHAGASAARHTSDATA
jgi:hypothetical protein